MTLTDEQIEKLVKERFKYLQDNVDVSTEMSVFYAQLRNMQKDDADVFDASAYKEEKPNPERHFRQAD